MQALFPETSKPVAVYVTADHNVRNPTDGGENGFQHAHPASTVLGLCAGGYQGYAGSPQSSMLWPSISGALSDHRRQ